MKQYEITFITLTDEKPARHASQGDAGGEKPVKEIIEALSGKVLKTESLGEKQFAYKIKKENKGFYTTVRFEISPEKTAELNKKLSMTEEILRFLIITAPNAPIKVEKHSEKPVATKEEIKEVEKEIAHLEEPVPSTSLRAGKKEEKVIAEPVEKELMVEEKPKKVKKVAPKKTTEKPVEKVEKEEPVSPDTSVSAGAGPDGSRGKKVEEIAAEEQSEEDRLKTLDEKLDELLKE